MVEQALKATSREYDLEQERYKQLSQQYAAAQLQETVARTRGGERFSVLNAAYLPDGAREPQQARAFSSSRSALGLALGGGAALGPRVPRLVHSRRPWASTTSTCPFSPRSRASAAPREAAGMER
jgi:hypothetical protein